MREELPPIAFLCAFSRAAETLSFKEAAADLGLSPSALSRQIMALEAHLGVVLFRRLNRVSRSPTRGVGIWNR